jgi:hypothetical protein
MMGIQETTTLSPSESELELEFSKEVKKTKSDTLYTMLIAIVVAILTSVAAIYAFESVEGLPLQRRALRELSREVHKLNEKVDSGSFNKHGYLPHLGEDDLTLANLEENFYTPAGITHDVFVKPIHSHNDYWRARPLFDALSLGVQSVEADVWYFPETSDNIYVGHSKRALKTNLLLDNMYLDPLNAILKGANIPQNDSVIAATGSGVHASTKQCGVFDTECDTTLYFFIDFKTDGDHLFDIIHAKFEKFRENGWLSYFNTTSGEFNWGPITVIGTGNTPIEKVLNQGERRDIFLDGPLDKLGGPEDDTVQFAISPVVSASLRMLIQQRKIVEPLTEQQVQQVKTQVDIAHKRGMKTRIWDTPWWPVTTKRSIWKQIIEEIHSDLLNADDLAEAVSFNGNVEG